MVMRLYGKLMRLPRPLLGKPRLLMRPQVVVHAVRSRSGLMRMGRAQVNLSRVYVF